MIDFHNHFLPDVDDGPKTMEESILMLKNAIQNGITEVVQTVHFQHPKMEGKNVDYSYLKNKVFDVENELRKQNLTIKIHLSSEVFYLPNLVEISNNPLLTIGDGKYMLIEFKPNIYPINYEKEFYDLQSVGITPIIAHPERYRFIQQNLSILDVWKNRGFVIQLDAGSLIGHFGEKIKDLSIKMIENGYVHLLGSDAHNSRKRNFCLIDAYSIIESILGIDKLNIMKKNSKNIVYGGDIISLDKLKNNKFSKYFYILKKIKNILKLDS
ncbi:hypothetical protein OAH62_02795 [Candidatus Marinimicrobia bacterium]|nr:hypothetical protein [Candidatus Neomarinimicrobiota bacterium]